MCIARGRDCGEEGEGVALSVQYIPARCIQTCFGLPGRKREVLTAVQNLIYQSNSLARGK